MNKYNYNSFIDTIEENKIKIEKLILWIFFYTKRTFSKKENILKAKNQKLYY